MRLTPFPIRYEELNELYAHTDQRRCLNAIPVPLDEAMSRSYFLAVRTGNNDGRPFVCYAIEQDGRIIGKIEATKETEQRAELDLIIRSGYCGRGHGSEALNAFIEELKQNGWCEELCAYAESGNLAMKRVLEKNGFSCERTFQADVITPGQSQYQLRSVQGEEYLRCL